MRGLEQRSAMIRFTFKRLVVVTQVRPGWPQGGEAGSHSGSFQDGHLLTGSRSDVTEEPLESLRWLGPG